MIVFNPKHAVRRGGQIVLQFDHFLVRRSLAVARKVGRVRYIRQVVVLRSVIFVVGIAALAFSPKRIEKEMLVTKV